MKKFGLLILLFAILGLASCSHDDIDKLIKPEIKGDAFDMKLSVSEQATFSMSLYGAGLVVDWGDGTGTEGDYFNTAKSPAQAISHTYAKSDTTYTVRVSAKGLKEMIVKSNQNISITQVNPRYCEDLYKLDLQNLDITSLDVTSCSALTSLLINSCSKVSTLKYVGDNILEFGCSGTNYPVQTAINDMPWIKILRCRNTNISALDVSKNSNIRLIDCRDNKFTKASFTSFFKTLPTITDATTSGQLYLSLADDYDPTEADNRNWVFFFPAN